MATNQTHFFYENLLAQSGASVTASNEDADFPVENAYDGFTNDYYKTGASGTTNITVTLTGNDSADYFAFYGTDAADNAGTIKLQYLDNSSPRTYQDCFSAYTVTSDDNVYIRQFDSQTSDTWRVVITGSASTSWADISFGSTLQFERGVYIGFTPPRFGRWNQLLNSESENGNFVGRSTVRSGIRTTFNFDNMTESWARTNWQPFVEHAELKPFYVLWDNDRYASEAAYVWSDGDIPTARIDSHRSTDGGSTWNGLMSASIDVKGYSSR